ncbi:hypothetical protein KSP39_PZI018939 [Platanthera zijinensis]|uniref:Uncharacterized protein n=1 Tax=Platanthera zijinensis TaxID=2320716 RepID=A0AAP0B3V4_9ASPA
MGIYNMLFPMVLTFMNYDKQIIVYGQSFIITLSHTNRLYNTIQYFYEKTITSKGVFMFVFTFNLINISIFGFAIRSIISQFVINSTIFRLG